MAESVQRRATRCMAGVRFAAEARNFSLFHSVQTGSGSHLGILSAGMKRQGPKPRMVELYLHSLMHLYGVMLN
jgi:hypothetical protein